MSNLALTWEYLTGYAVATDPSSRERAEWPPHPARLFLALAAAWFETEPPSDDHAAHAEWAAEGAALKWLESLGDPELLLPEVTADAHRTMVTVYVPVNDKAGPSAASLQSCPSMNRSKQPRTFPKVWVGRQPCLALWETAEGDKHQGLEQLVLAGALGCLRCGVHCAKSVTGGSDWTLYPSAQFWSSLERVKA